MTTVEASVEIRAPIEEVWRIVSDPRNLPRWDSRILSVESPPEDGLEVGSRYSAVVGFMAVKARVSCEVLEVTVPSHAKIHLRGVVDAIVETTLAPIDERRTLLHHHVEYKFPGGPLGGIVANAVNLLGAPMLLRHGAQGQKRQVEEEVPAG